MSSEKVFGSLMNLHTVHVESMIKLYEALSLAADKLDESLEEKDTDKAEKVLDFLEDMASELEGYCNDSDVTAETIKERIEFLLDSPKEAA